MPSVTAPGLDAAGSRLPARLCTASCALSSLSSTYLIVPLPSPCVPWALTGIAAGAALPQAPLPFIDARKRQAGLLPHLLVSPRVGVHHSGAQRTLCWRSHSPRAPLLPVLPAGAEPEPSRFHGHYSPSDTNHYVPNLTNERGSSSASPWGGYAAGGGCYRACRLACLLLAMQAPGAGWAGSSASSGSPLCRLSPLVHTPRGGCAAGSPPPGAPSPPNWGSRLVSHSGPSPGTGTQPRGGHQHQCCAIPPCPPQSFCPSLATDMAVPQPNRHLCTHSSHQCCHPHPGAEVSPGHSDPWTTAKCGVR